MGSCSVECSRKRKEIDAKAQRMCTLPSAYILIAGSSDLSTTAPQERLPENICTAGNPKWIPDPRTAPSKPQYKITFRTLERKQAEHGTWCRIGVGQTTPSHTVDVAVEVWQGSLRLRDSPHLSCRTWNLAGHPDQSNSPSATQTVETAELEGALKPKDSQYPYPGNTREELPRSQEVCQRTQCSVLMPKTKGQKSRTQFLLLHQRLVGLLSNHYSSYQSGFPQWKLIQGNITHQEASVKYI